MAKKEKTLAQPELSALMCTRGLPSFPFLVRVHACVVVRSPVGAYMEGSLSMFLSPFHSLAMSLGEF